MCASTARRYSTSVIAANGSLYEVHEHDSSLIGVFHSFMFVGMFHSFVSVSTIGCLSKVYQL